MLPVISSERSRRAEEDDARDVVRHRDAAERKLRAELVEREPGRLERRPLLLEAGSERHGRSDREHADAVRAELDRERLA